MAGSLPKLLRPGECILLRSSDLEEVLLIETVSERGGSPIYTGRTLSTAQTARLVCTKNKNGSLHLSRASGVIHFEEAAPLSKFQVQQYIKAQRTLNNIRAKIDAAKATASADYEEKFKTNSIKFRKLFADTG